MWRCVHAYVVCFCSFNPHNSNSDWMLLFSPLHKKKKKEMWQSQTMCSTLNSVFSFSIWIQVSVPLSSKHSLPGLLWCFPESPLVRMIVLSLMSPDAGRGVDCAWNRSYADIGLDTPGAQECWTKNKYSQTTDLEAPTQVSVQSLWIRHCNKLLGYWCLARVGTVALLQYKGLLELFHSFAITYFVYSESWTWSNRCVSEAALGTKGCSHEQTDLSQ